MPARLRIAATGVFAYPATVSSSARATTSRSRCAARTSSRLRRWRPRGSAVVGIGSATPPRLVGGDAQRADGGGEHLVVPDEERQLDGLGLVEVGPHRRPGAVGQVAGGVE